MWHEAGPPHPGWNSEDDLPLESEQGGLWPEKGPGKARVGGEAYVVLGTSGVSPQEQRVSCWHLKISRDSIVGMKPR
jgi:hypothetical protein